MDQALNQERLEKLFYFATETLGYDRLGELHLSWFDILLREKKVLMIAPPGHFKTSAGTIAYPLFRLTEDPNMKILMVNEILDNSKSFLREIKTHLKQNEKFRAKFGSWDVTADTWTEERIQIPRSEIRKEPSIAAASVLGTVVSTHPNLIIVDDPCSNRNTQTPHQREKVINWFKKDLLPRLDEDEGQIIVIMTRWHTEDLAGFIMNDPGYADWKVINMPAEWLDENSQRHILFPEKFSAEKLDKIKGRMGLHAYNLLYLNDPAGTDGADFRTAWIDSSRYDKVPEGLTVFAGIDLAIGRKEGNARFAYIVIGMDKNGDILILDGYRDRIPFTDQLSAAKRINHLHHPRLIVVETNAYQTVFVESLRTDPETRHLPLKDQTTQGDKDARLRGLAPLFQNGIIRLPRNGGLWVDHLTEELLHFPSGTKDMLDALWLAIQGVELQRTEPKILFTDDLPEDGYHRRSVAWA
jgi:predicted phage terminase large subunit-like protein